MNEEFMMNNRNKSIDFILTNEIKLIKGITDTFFLHWPIPANIQCLNLCIDGCSMLYHNSASDICVHNVSNVSTIKQLPCSEEIKSRPSCKLGSSLMQFFIGLYVYTMHYVFTQRSKVAKDLAVASSHMTAKSHLPPVKLSVYKTNWVERGKSKHL